MFDTEPQVDKTDAAAELVVERDTGLTFRDEAAVEGT